MEDAVKCNIESSGYKLLVIEALLDAPEHAVELSLDTYLKAGCVTSWQNDCVGWMN
jgi:hypothetical protein